MSIFRSGLVKASYVICIQPFKQGDFLASKGEKYELVLDMAAMYVIKTPQGAELVVPKTAFAPAPGEA